MSSSSTEQYLNSKVYCNLIGATIGITAILPNSLSLNYDRVLEKLLDHMKSQGVVV